MPGSPKISPNGGVLIIQTPRVPGTSVEFSQLVCVLGAWRQLSCGNTQVDGRQPGVTRDRAETGRSFFLLCCSFHKILGLEKDICGKKCLRSPSFINSMRLGAGAWGGRSGGLLVLSVYSCARWPPALVFHHLFLSPPPQSSLFLFDRVSCFLGWF